MKTRKRSKGKKNRAMQNSLLGHCVIGASLLVYGAPAPAQADDTNTVSITPEQMFEGGTNTYKNWVELSFGGLATSGNSAQAQERERLNSGVFGGIEDLHFKKEVAKDTTFSIDGRALVDNHDYKLKLNLTHPELWYLRLNFENFRTWYNDDGAYYPPVGLQYSHTDNALGVDRGEVSFEAGLSLKKAPKLSFKYTHRYRDGQKSSTIWGPLHPDLVDPTRGVYPAYYDIDEKADIFELNASQQVKKTAIGLGLRYETGDQNDARKTTFWQGEPVQQKLTDRQGASYDLLSVHAFTETWLKNNLFFSSGFMFANLDSDFTGSRIYGSDYDVAYMPDSLSPLGYNTLNGGYHKNEYVLNLNLMATPWKHFSVIPSIRVQKECWNADSTGMATLSDFSSEAFNDNSDRDAIDVRERLDLRYKGLTNWVLYATGEWTEGQGNLKENGNLSQVNGIGVSPIQRKTEDSRLFQKYSAGARWYPARNVTVDAGGYYKANKYDYNNTLDSTPNDPGSFNRYPAYLVMQNFETYDGSLRLTLRPVQNVSLVSRYEYQFSTVHTRPESASGAGEVESADITSHILGENVGWTPWSRLGLQVGFNYVLSDTETPTADLTQAILNAQNNYWTVNFNASVVLDDKTDLNLGYFYYQSDNYQDNSLAGLPLGASADEHGITAMLTRRISENLRVNLKYGFYRYDDVLSGGNNNYEAHVFYTSLQYRF